MNTELLRKQASSEETIPWLLRFCLQMVSDQFARIQLTEKKFWVQQSIEVSDDKNKIHRFSVTGWSELKDSFKGDFNQILILYPAIPLWWSYTRWVTLKKKVLYSWNLQWKKNIPTLWGLGMPCVHTQEEKLSNAVMQIR